MNEGNKQGFSAAEIAELFALHAVKLRAFARGILKNADLADEVVQTAFVKLAERGHEIQADSAKAWLYRVVFNDAITVRRRGKVEAKTKQIMRAEQSVHSTDETVISRDMIRLITAELERIPAEQQEIVRKRIYEGKTFAVIAEELDLPLGTVLTRMRLALKKLKQRLQNEMDS